MNLRIVSDAAYSHIFRLTGYACVIEGDFSRLQEIHTGVSAEEVDNTQAELLGMYAALVVATNKQDNQNVHLSGIEIFCDCEAAIEIVNAKQTQHQEYADLKEKIDHLMQMYGWQDIVTFEHVKGHVHSLNASPIEKLNAIADDAARTVRNEALSRLIEPSKYHSEHISIIVPANPDDKTSKSLSNLVEHAELEELNVRLYIDDKNTLPHTHYAILKAASISRSTADTIITPIAFEKQKQLTISATPIRRYIGLKGLSTPADFNQSSEAFSAITASELLYGKAPYYLSRLQKTKEYLQAPIYPIMSEILIDLTQDECTNNWNKVDSVKTWAHELALTVNCPVVNSYEQAMHYLNHIDMHKLKRLSHADTSDSQRGRDTARKLSAATFKLEHLQSLLAVSDFDSELKNIIFEYGELPNDQLSEKVSRLMDEHGYSSHPIFRDSVSRFFNITSKTNLNVFTNRLAKHISKMHVPDESKQTNIVSGAPPHNPKRVHEGKPLNGMAEHEHEIKSRSQLRQ